VNINLILQNQKGFLISSLEQTPKEVKEEEAKIVLAAPSKSKRLKMRG